LDSTCVFGLIICEAEKEAEYFIGYIYGLQGLCYENKNRPTLICQLGAVNSVCDEL